MANTKTSKPVLKTPHWEPIDPQGSVPVPKAVQKEIDKGLLKLGLMMGLSQDQVEALLMSMGNIKNAPSQENEAKWCWMEPQIKCPKCDSTINGLGDAIVKQPKGEKFAIGPTMPVLGGTQEINYTVHGCGCHVTQLWASRYAEEINRRRSGEKPHEILPLTTAQVGQLKEKYLVEIMTLWQAFDHYATSNDPYMVGKAHAVKKQLLGKIEKFMALHPYSPVTEVQKITTVEQMRTALLNGYPVQYGYAAPPPGKPKPVNWKEEQKKLAEEQAYVKQKQQQQQAMMQAQTTGFPKGKTYSDSEAVKKNTDAIHKQVQKTAPTAEDYKSAGYSKKPVNPSQFAPVASKHTTPKPQHPNPNPGPTKPVNAPAPPVHLSGKDPSKMTTEELVEESVKHANNIVDYLETMIPQPSGMKPQPLYKASKKSKAGQKLSPELQKIAEQLGVAGTIDYEDLIQAIKEQEIEEAKNGVNQPYPGEATIIPFKHSGDTPEYQIGDVYKVDDKVLGLVRDVIVSFSPQKGHEVQYNVAVTSEAPMALVATGAVALQFTFEKNKPLAIGDLYQDENGNVIGVVMSIDNQPAHNYATVAVLPGQHNHPKGTKTGGSASILQHAIKRMDVSGVNTPFPPGVAKRRRDTSIDFTERPKRRISKKRRKKPKSEG